MCFSPAALPSSPVMLASSLEIEPSAFRCAQIGAELVIIQIGLWILSGGELGVINRTFGCIQTRYVCGARFVRPASVCILPIEMVVLVFVYHQGNLAGLFRAFLFKRGHFQIRDIAHQARNQIRAPLSFYLGPLRITAGTTGLGKGCRAAIFAAFFRFRHVAPVKRIGKAVQRLLPAYVLVIHIWIKLGFPSRHRRTPRTLGLMPFTKWRMW